MARRRRISAFDRWMGGRVYSYFIIGWFCMIAYCFMVMYPSSIWKADTLSFYDIALFGIGMMASILVPFLILVFLDYIAFRIYHRKPKQKPNKSILGYAGGWEIQSAIDHTRIALDHVRIPILNEDQLPDEEYSLDKTKEET